MQAPPYARRKDFTQDDGDQTDHAALNAELDGAASSIQGLRGNLALLQRDDGMLRDGLVGADTLNPHFKADLIKQLSGNIDGKLNEAQTAASAATTAAKTAQGAEQASARAQQQAEIANNAAQLNAKASANSSAEAATAKETAITAQDNAKISAKEARASQTASAQSALYAAEKAQIASHASVQAGEAAQQSSESAAAASQSANTAQSSADTATSAALETKKRIDEATQLGTPADDTVTTRKLVKGAVTSSKLAPKTVTTDKLVEEAVTASKLAPDLVFKGVPVAPTPPDEDVSERLATTSWVSNAMATLANVAGFAHSYAENGYIKFPSWLGGLVIQWGLVSTNEADGPRGGTHRSFPIAFPMVCYQIIGSDSGGAAGAMAFAPISTTQFTVWAAGGIGKDWSYSSFSPRYIAIGR